MIINDTNEQNAFFQHKRTKPLTFVSTHATHLPLPQFYYTVDKRRTSVLKSKDYEKYLEDEETKVYIYMCECISCVNEFSLPFMAFGNGLLLVWWLK